MLIIDGSSIAYIEVNSPVKETIFFIHGNSRSAATWERQLYDLSFQHYRLIAVDLPGHGASFRQCKENFTDFNWNK